MITIKAGSAKQFWQALIGVMFTQHIKPFYLETRFGIHTCFVSQPIIVCILDEHAVIKSKRIVKPWNIYLWNPRYFRVLELPADSREANLLKINQKVNLVFD